MNRSLAVANVAAVLLVLALDPVIALGAMESKARQPSEKGARPRTPAAKPGAAVEGATWVDHDGAPAAKPRGRDPSLYGHLFREAIVEPLSHAFDIPDKILWALGPMGVKQKQPSANVNAFDEVPNSTWFTNRNHFRALSLREVRDGAFGASVPEKPWTVTDLKKSGFNPGFQIKDAKGKKWLVKLDPIGHPQLGSGAGAIVGRLVWAAGYNVPHDEAVTFRREDLKTKAPDPEASADEEPPPTMPQIEEILGNGARAADGRYYASASLFLPGKPLGPLRFRSTRPDDPNDWYKHENRRELRGLYVVFAWLNNWDVKDHQSLDMFHETRDSLGYVAHNLLDMNASLGAAAEGPKQLPHGYEQRIDLSWIAKRLLTLGFVTEPWRRARQETGIPSVGNFESADFEPDHWQPSQMVQPFREMAEADGYWGAKLVASFSDAQIAAAIEAAGYEDPRAPAYLHRALTERRDKIARYWFDRVAPLDFFHVENGALCFRDLAVDIGLTGARAYDIDVLPSGEESAARRLRSTDTELPLTFAKGASELTLELSIEGSRAKPVRVDLIRKGATWIVAKVRHG